MTFDEILDQAIEMLQRRGRLTYRALQRQFNLDDAYLEDLKDELIEGQRLATDENGRVLVWTGETDARPVSASPLEQAEHQSAVQPDDQLSQAATPVPEPPILDAERRQLTVMFCDLADSTRLSGQLDPEDLRDVIRAYQSTSAEVIERYDGHIPSTLAMAL